MFLQYVLITIVSCILHLPQIRSITPLPNKSNDGSLTRQMNRTHYSAMQHSWTEPCITVDTSRHCYEIFDTRSTWKNASVLCKHYGGNLVTIESVEEQKFIEDLMKNRTFNAEGLWIGSDKLHPEEQRAWANGEKFSYVNWAPGEPNSPLIDENCVEISTDDGTWNDAPCAKRNGYICENSDVTAPESSHEHQLSEHESFSGWSRTCIKDHTNSHCYEMFDTEITWKNASDLCKHDGGNLVTIESYEKQLIIEDLMNNRIFNVEGLWIGSDKLHPKEQRAWANGEHFSYENFAQGEPNNPMIDENCVAIYTNDSTWNDVRCTDRNGYICENSGAVGNYTQNNNTARWYKLVDELITWNEANNICDKDGGTLMIIESAEEQTFIADQIRDEHREAKGLWLGSNMVHPESKRRWTNGNTFPYVNWAKGEPNNSPYVENCVEMYTDNSSWNDRECNFLRGYICEKTHWTEPCIKDNSSGHCYQIFDTRITWKNASDVCKHDGGNLATIESVQEQKFIEDLIANRLFYVEGLWIGSDKLHPEEKRAWANGENFSYVNWALGEPNGLMLDENCVEIYTVDRTWNDVRCKERKGYICENSALRSGTVGSYIQDNNTGHWYKLVDHEEITWEKAFNICLEDGGTLMIIESAEEQKFIADLIQPDKNLEAKGLWLGSNKVHPESNRIWTNKKKFVYANWAKGEPNNSPNVENCAEMYTSNRKWNDLGCNVQRGYICEKTHLSEPCIEYKIRGHCYQIFDAKITWKNASDMCKHDGGNLITIESVEEQRFIEDLMKNRTFYADGLWIGSDKLHPEEQRAWANGEKFSYANWSPGEPSSQLIDENCIEIHTNDSTWNDAMCTERNGYICENSGAVKNYLQDKNTGHWYKLVDELFTWVDAFNICDKEGSKLMIIESKEEQMFIAGQIQVKQFDAKGLWIGSNMVHPVWKRAWTNGKKFTYLNWAKGEPNNYPHVENCAEMYTSNFMWNDRDCTVLRGYICEKSPEVTPDMLIVIVTTVGSAAVILVGVMILCCLLHKRNKCKKKKNKDYEDVQNMEMNQAEHEYNRDIVLSENYNTINDN